MLGADWKWLSQALTPLTPAKAKAPTGIDALFDPKTAYYLMHLNGDQMFDYVAVSTNHVGYSINQGGFFGPIVSGVSASIQDPSLSFALDFDVNGIDDVLEIGSNVIRLNSPLSDVNGNISFSSSEISLPVSILHPSEWNTGNSFLTLSPAENSFSAVRVEPNNIYFVPWSGAYDDANSTTTAIDPDCFDGCVYDKVVDFVVLDKNAPQKAVDFVSFVPGNIFIKRGDGTGSFGSLTTLPIPQDCSKEAFRAMVDLNADGLADYICVDQTEIRTWLAEPSVGGVFALSQSPSISVFEVGRDWPRRVQLDDFNSDGMVDFAVTYTSSNMRKKSGLIISGLPADKGNSFEIGTDGQSFYKPGSASGVFGPASFFSVSPTIMADVHDTPDEKGSQTFWSSIAEVSSAGVFDLVVVGHDKLWLQPTIFPPKLLKSHTKPATIPSWRRQIWSRQFRRQVP